MQHRRTRSRPHARRHPGVLRGQDPARHRLRGGMGGRHGTQATEAPCPGPDLPPDAPAQPGSGALRRRERRCWRPDVQSRSRSSRTPSETARRVVQHAVDVVGRREVVHEAGAQVRPATQHRGRDPGPPATSSARCSRSGYASSTASSDASGRGRPARGGNRRSTGPGRGHRHEVLASATCPSCRRPGRGCARSAGRSPRCPDASRRTTASARGTAACPPSSTGTS